MARWTRLHLRLMSAFAVIWYAINALDYLFTQIQFPIYTRLFSDEVVTFFTGMPAWADAIWSIGVWGGLLGALLMWSGARRSAAILSLGPIALGLLSLWLILLARPPMISVTGWPGVYVMLGATAVSLLIWLYARAMHARGLLP